MTFIPVSTTNTNLSVARRQGWLFPDNTINPTADIIATRFHTLKPVWYQVEATGLLTLRNNASFGSNFFYTTANAKIVRDNSTEQYVNVSCGTGTDMNALCSSAPNRATAISTLTAFCVTNQFTGVEIDFEGYGTWTAPQYTNFKVFIAELGTALHVLGMKLMVDVPPIWNNSVTVTANEWTNRNSQGYYQLKYEDFNMLPVDYILPMSYDYQFDMSAGTPNAPLAWVEDIIKWTKSKITDWNKIVIGLPTAGYSGLTGGYVITGRTYDYLSIQTGFSGAVRDVASAEIIWSDAGTSYALNDETSVNTKMKSAEAFGVKNISLWHIGQNKYDNLRVHGVQPLDTTVPSVSDVDITTVTTTSTLPTASRFVVSTGTITLTLPTGVLGQIVSIKNVGTGTVTATSSGTIDFGTSFATATVALTSDTSQDFLYDGTNWQRI